MLRELTPDDATDRYFSWLSDADARRFITAAAHTKGRADLRQYVTERVGREDVLFLGIFDKASGLHIGNIKYEPLDARAGYAVMGILVGDPAFRGKGVTTEVLRTSGEWLKQHRGVREIALGVSRDNAAAVRAYEKVGFAFETTPHIPKAADGAATMVWRP
jgi:ribosomal-protein-alanine N-acetyltransferase